MPVKILVPVLPSDRFYEAVVSAGDLLAEKGGTVTFLFTALVTPPELYDQVASQTESELDVPPDGPLDVDPREIDHWQEGMIAELEDARQLLHDRGIGDEQIGYMFADREPTTAQTIADEAAGGAFDIVVLSRGEFIHLPDLAEESPRDIAAEVQRLRPDVKLLVT